jgi:DNA polymerase-3 subunit epsilon
LHGALLDAELLADVYLAMTRGQNSLSMELDVVDERTQISDSLPLPELIFLAADEQEMAAHESVLNGLDKEVRGTCLWRTVG